MESCRSYIREVKSEGVVIIVGILEHVVQLYPSHMPTLLLPLLPNLLSDTMEEVVWNTPLSLLHRCFKPVCNPVGLTGKASFSIKLV